jgi:hypothetical protein
MAKGKWIKFEPKKRPADYEDPPEVLARQFYYLEKWKAEGKVINQPRIAWALARARRWWENARFNTSEWGWYMRRKKSTRRAGLARAKMPDWKAHCDANRAKAHRLRRDKSAAKVNPLAIPEKPKKVGRRLSL